MMTQHYHYHLTPLYGEVGREKLAFLIKITYNASTVYTYFKT